MVSACTRTIPTNELGHLCKALIHTKLFIRNVQWNGCQMRWRIRAEVLPPVLTVQRAERLLLLLLLTEFGERTPQRTHLLCYPPNAVTPFERIFHNEIYHVPSIAPSARDAMASHRLCTHINVGNTKRNMFVDNNKVKDKLV